MSFIVIDTETSGLPLYKDKETGVPIPADDPRQPYLAQLAIIRVGPDLEIESMYDGYVRPDGWEMEPGATAVNGLTTEFLLANGSPIGVVLDVYVAAIGEGRAVVAHNAQHDCKALPRRTPPSRARRSV